MLSRIAGAIRGSHISSSERSVGSRISAAALAIGGFTVGVKAVALGSTLLIASFFGTGDDLEAFLIAFLLPSMGMSVICGAFRSALIPTYVQVREQYGSLHAQSLFSRIMFVASGILLLSVGCFAVLVPYLLPLLASGFPPTKLALAIQLSYLLLPVIAVKGVATIYGAALNAEERFSLVAAAPALIPASTILFMLLWPVPATRIYGLAVATIVGMVGELIAVSWALKLRGIALLPRRAASSAASRQVISQYFPILAGALLMSGTAFVDEAMAASLSAGSLASLSYGGRFVNVILQVLSGAIATAVLPFFSKLVERAQLERAPIAAQGVHCAHTCRNGRNYALAGRLFRDVDRLGTATRRIWTRRHRTGRTNSGGVRVADSILRLRHNARSRDLVAEGQPCPRDRVLCQPRHQHLLELPLHADMGRYGSGAFDGLRVSVFDCLYHDHGISNSP